MRLVIYLFFIFSLNASSFYTDEYKRLFFENGRYAGITGVEIVDYDLSQNDFGFLLMTNSQLKIAFLENGNLKVYVRPLSFNAIEVEYPYFIDQTNRLYVFNQNSLKADLLAHNVTGLCARTIKETISINEHYRYYRIKDNHRLVEINQNHIPKYCQ